MLPAELNNKYEVRGTLGAGAMGTVYDAIDRIIERRVAIKVVKRPAENDAEAVEAHARFRREAQAAGRLSHPNIVGVYDYGENAHDAWIVMELVEGKSLKDRLDKNERFTIPDIVRIMGEVCAGLAYSHQRGVVHRDIKPGNIMMTTDGQVKIADFGIARLENSSMTQVGTLIGTPSYMAPEQFRGEPVDLRADIWSSGVMLYQLLTGEKPFEGGFSAVMHKALHTEPPPPSQLSVTTPRGFDAVIARALAKRPDDRFRSAGEFADAIRAAVHAPAAAAEPAGLPGLPGLNDDATMVAARPAGGGTMNRPAAAAPPAPATPTGKGAPIGLIAGGAGALVVAAAAGWYFVAGPGAGPDPAIAERQRQEQAAAEASAREAAARLQAAQEASAREAAAREQAARTEAAQQLPIARRGRGDLALGFRAARLGRRDAGIERGIG
ncbi:serine/threonine-protein kinase, partial [Roseomonas sp. CECT 9278]|uniref:serine/threonine-protein kinase n=1 Tax=Roseomonas sp. CECT 9278 TaxID=2845823 RepID=UPI001E51AC57